MKPNLTPEEKVMAIRRQQGKSRQSLAEHIQSNMQRLDRIERLKNLKYTAEEWPQAKEFLGIVGMPLEDSERPSFIESVLIFGEMVSADRMEEAKTIYERLLPVYNIEIVDPELSWLFRLVCVPYSIKQGKLEEARKEMSFFDNSFGDKKAEDLTPRLLYHYYRNKGRLYFFDFDKEKSKEFYEKALDVAQNNESFSQKEIYRSVQNVASCYTELGLPNKALLLLRDARNFCDRLDFFTVRIDTDMALNYARIGEFEESKKLITKTLARAEGFQNNFFVGLVWYIFGLVHKFAKNWDEAIESFEKALSYHDTNSIYHMWSYYYQIRCVIEKRDFIKAKTMINEMETLHGDNEEMEIPINYITHFKIISKGITTFRQESVDYVENVAIPYFLKRHYKYEAMRACELLIEHYKRARKTQESYRIMEMLLEIHRSFNLDYKPKN
ncbi:MAG: tetratricopeptide repeat protein [Defluviitaleaceae bacterium]|nr:tetratricopeptide repeat protein [Defluviitaleaceae bacterium]